MDEIVVGQWYQLATGERVRVDALDDDAGLVSVTTSDGKPMELLLTALNGAVITEPMAPAQSADDEAYWSRVAEMLDETDWQQETGSEAAPGDSDPATDGAEVPLHETELEQTVPEPLRPAARSTSIPVSPEESEPPMLEDEAFGDDEYHEEPAAGVEPKQYSFEDHTPAVESTPVGNTPDQVGTTATPSSADSTGNSNLSLWMALVAIVFVLGSSFYQQMRIEMLEEQIAELAANRGEQSQQAALARSLETIEMLREDVAGLAAMAEQVDRLRAEATLTIQEHDSLRKTVDAQAGQIEGLRTSHNMAVGDLRGKLAAQEPQLEIDREAVPVGPVVEVIEVTTVAEAPPIKPEASRTGGYAVVVISLPTAARAVEARTELAAKGLSLVERSAVVNGHTWYRLLVEGFETHQSAKDFVTRMASEYEIDNAWVLRP